MAVIDYSGVKGGNRDNIVGEGDAVLTKYEEKPSKKGNPTAWMTYTLTSGEHEGRTVIDFVSLTESSLWKSKSAFIALGADPDLFAGKIDTEEIGQSLVGSECHLVLSERPDDSTGQIIMRQDIKVLSIRAF